MRLTILAEGEGLIAVDKPAGLESTGRTPSDPGGVEHHLRSKLGRQVWLVHQLDRDTSGVLLFVTRKRLVAPTSELLRSGEKRYLALVARPVPWDRHALSAALRYDRHRRRWIVDPAGKAAQTRFERIGPAGSPSALWAFPRTGRTHQIRVHLEHLGLPLLGERKYAQPPCEGAPRHALHLDRVKLADGRIFHSPLPPDLAPLIPFSPRALPEP